MRTECVHSCERERSQGSGFHGQANTLSENPKLFAHSYNPFDTESVKLLLICEQDKYKSKPISCSNPRKYRSCPFPPWPWIHLPLSVYVDFRSFPWRYSRVKVYAVYRYIEHPYPHGLKVQYVACQQPKFHVPGVHCNIGSGITINYNSSESGSYYFSQISLLYPKAHHIPVIKSTLNDKNPEKTPNPKP